MSVSFIPHSWTKADDLAAWDTPPPTENERLFTAYKSALKRYLRDRKITIPILGKLECERREARAGKFTRPPSTQPECIVGGVSSLACYENQLTNPDPDAFPNERFPVVIDKILQTRIVYFSRRYGFG
jgi:hypothetical protein